MSRTQNELRKRFRGATLGAAVADALALPYADYSREFLRSHATPLTAQYVAHHSGFYPLGQYGSTTQLMLAVVGSILEAEGVDGGNVASHFTPLWRDQLLIERHHALAEPMERIVKGLRPWDECALDAGRAEITPIGPTLGAALWGSHDAQVLADGAERVVRLTHSDSRVLACAAGAAAAIAHNANTGELVLGTFLDAVCDAARSFDPRIADELLDFPRVLSMTDNRALLHFEKILPDERYPSTANGLGSYCVPAFWTAMYSFLKNPHSYTKCVENCICAGGEINAPTFLGGALVGALLGEDGIPDSLRDGLVGTDEIEARTNDLLAACSARRPRSQPSSELEP
jgi:ADP-ribosylglycohydrolase